VSGPPIYTLVQSLEVDIRDVPASLSTTNTLGTSGALITLRPVIL